MLKIRRPVDHVGDDQKGRLRRDATHRVAHRQVGTNGKGGGCGSS
jgi:hypothetical protein